ncbi:hypothetical protein V6N13_015622 [Hibiscus sabdariffa]
MAKKASKSKKDSSSSTSVASAKCPSKASTQEDFRKEFQEQNPDIKSMRDIGKACGEKWKTMTYEEIGKDEETEDDSEYDE